MGDCWFTPSTTSASTYRLQGERFTYHSDFYVHHIYAKEWVHSQDAKLGSPALINKLDPEWYIFKTKTNIWLLKNLICMAVFFFLSFAKSINLAFLCAIISYLWVCFTATTTRCCTRSPAAWSCMGQLVFLWFQTCVWGGQTMCHQHL